MEILQLIGVHIAGSLMLVGAGFGLGIYYKSKAVSTAQKAEALAKQVEQQAQAEFKKLT
jgi:hypothetical protein